MELCKLDYNYGAINGITTMSRYIYIYTKLHIYIYKWNITMGQSWDYEPYGFFFGIIMG